MMPQPSSPSPVPPKPAPSEGNADRMKESILAAAKQLKMVADKYGVDLSSVFTAPAEGEQATPPPPAGAEM